MGRKSKLPDTDMENDAAVDAVNIFTKGLEAANTQATEISIDQIYIVPQFRKHFDAAEIEKLAQAIEAKGFLGAITVKELNHQEQEEYGAQYRYRLITGETRIKAMLQLKKADIPADIKPADLSELDVRRIQADENLVRNDLNALEEHQCLLQMMSDEVKLTADKAKAVINKIRNDREKELSQDVLTSYNAMQQVIIRYKGEKTRTTPASLLTTLMELQKFDGPLLEALQRKITYSKLRLLLKLTKQQQAEIIEQIEKEDLTVSDIKSIVQELRQKTEASQDVPTTKKTLSSSSKKPSNTVVSNPVSIELKQAVKKLTTKKVWKKISGDTLKLKRAEALLQELNALLGEVNNI